MACTSFSLRPSGPAAARRELVTASLRTQQPANRPLLAAEPKRQPAIVPCGRTRLVSSRGGITAAAEPDNVPDYEKKGGLLESEAFATILKVVFVATSVGAVVGMVFLATPIIDNTVGSFPGSQAGQEVSASEYK